MRSAHTSHFTLMWLHTIPPLPQAGSWAPSSHIYSHFLFPAGWKLGKAFYGPATVQKMSPAQTKLLDEAAAAARQAGTAPVPEAGSLAAEVSVGGE